MIGSEMFLLFLFCSNMDLKSCIYYIICLNDYSTAIARV